MKSKLVAIDYYLPEKKRTNQDLEIQFPDFKAEKVKKKIGISSRHIAAETETALDMAEKVCNQIFSTCDRQQIDYLLFCTQSPDFLLPTSACILQERLQLRRNIGALDFNLGCSGFVYGLSLAKGLIAAGIAEHVLLVTAETYSKYLNADDKGNMSLFGDAAAATVIAKNDCECIHAFSLGTDGRGFRNLIIANGGSRFPQKNGSGDDFLYMDGPEIFNFTIEALPSLIDDVLKKNHITKDDVNLFVFHQANKYMLNSLQKMLEIPEEKFYINLDETGNTVSCTIPIALKQANESGLIKPEDKILLAGFGVGYSYGATIITF